MTMEQILADIRSPRVKKVIHDADMGIEMDDQYALAFCLGASDKIKLLSAQASTFGKGPEGDYTKGMEASYQEILRVLDVCGAKDKYPAYRGATRPMGFDEPVITDAARNIIRTSKEYPDEIIYVLATGCCTNVSSAFLTDPSIKENTVVIWLGGTNLEDDSELAEECNLAWDRIAGQYLMSLGVPLIYLTAYDHGTCVLEITRETLNVGLPGDSRVARFFRDELPDKYSKEAYYVNGFWKRILFDVAAPAVLTNPEAYDFRVIPAPVITDDGKYAFDCTRHEIIYLEKMEKEPVLEATWEYIRRLCH